MKDLGEKDRWRRKKQRKGQVDENMTGEIDNREMNGYINFVDG